MFFGGPFARLEAFPIRDGGIEVVEVSQRSLADRAGIREGDILVSLNGIPVEDLERDRLPWLFQDDKLERVEVVRQTERFEIVFHR